MAIVQCHCGNGTYDDEKYNGRLTQCYRCSIKGKVKCPVCTKKWVDPKSYSACFECNTSGRRAVCPYCQDPSQTDVEFRNQNGTSLLCGSCYRTYGPIIVGALQPPQQQMGSSYTPDFGTRDPGQEFASQPPAGFGFDDLPSGFDAPQSSPPPPAGFHVDAEDRNYPGVAPKTVIFGEPDADRPQVYVPWQDEWILASDYRMPDHNVICYTREGKFPKDWKSRKVAHVRGENESLEDFLKFIDLMELVDPKDFVPMECVCLNYDHELCPNDGNPIFNGEAVCLDCINNTDPDTKSNATPEPDPVEVAIGNQDTVDRSSWVEPPPF